MKSEDCSWSTLWNIELNYGFSLFIFTAATILEVELFKVDYGSCSLGFVVSDLYKEPLDYVSFEYYCNRYDYDEDKAGMEFFITQ